MQSEEADNEFESRLDGLVAAIEAEDKPAILDWIRSEHFTLVSLSNDEESLGHDIGNGRIPGTSGFP